MDFVEDPQHRNMDLADLVYGPNDMDAETWIRKHRSCIEDPETWILQVILSHGSCNVS